MLDSEDTILQSMIDAESADVSWSTCSVSARSMPPTDFVSHKQEQKYYGNTKSDMAMCDWRSLRSDFSISLSGDDISSRRYPISLPTIDEAESISDWVIRARNRPFLPLLILSG